MASVNVLSQPEWLVGGGAMGETVRAFDWSLTPLGTRDEWPLSLRTAVVTCLNTRFPVYLLWGSDLTMVYNDAYVTILGARHPAALGCSAREIWSEAWHVVESQVTAGMERGEAYWQERAPFRVSRNGYEEECWFTYSLSPLFAEDGRPGGLACIVTEETEHVLAEHHQAFRVEFSRIVRDTASASETVARSVDALGRHLGVSLAGYGRVQPGGESIVLDGSYANGVEPLAGTFSLSAFGDENIALQREGVTVVRNDIASHAADFVWRQLDIQSFVSVPLVRSRRFDASFFVANRRPRKWTTAEVELIEEVAARLWAELDRAEVEQERRASEERLNFALEAGGGVGTWDCDVQNDRLRCNDRFAKLFSVDPQRAAAGAPVAEYLPAIHPDDRVAMEEKLRQLFENGGDYTAEYRVVLADNSVHWLFARGRCHLGETGRPSRFTGVVFDITDRKSGALRDAFLVQLDDAVRPLTEPLEITQTAARLLGEHLVVNRCAYADVEADQNTFNLTGDYNHDVQSIVGRYTFAEFGEECLRQMRAGEPYVVNDSETDPRTEAVRDAYRVASVRSVICVSVLKQSRFVAAFAVHQKEARTWKQDEVDLVQQVAGRCWESIERARIARELREREQRYRFLAESIPQMVWTATPDGALDYVSSQVAQYFGVDARTVLGEGWLRWVHPEDQRHTVECWKRSLATGEPYDTWFRLLHAADQSWRWHLVRALPLIGDTGEIRQWFGTCTDIEDPKNAEAELRHQWNTFDTALASTPDLLCIFDTSGRLTYANRPLLQLWQRSQEDVLGKDTFDLQYPPELARRLQCQVKQVLETRGTIRDRTPFTGSDGATRMYEYIFSPIADSGQVTAVCCSARDVTERDQMERELAASRERLSTVLEQAPVAIIVFRGRDFEVELANPFYRALLPGRELVGRRFFDVVPEIGGDLRETFNRVLETGQPFTVNEWHIPYDSDRDGLLEDHWFNVAFHPLRESDGEVSGFIAVLADVTTQVVARQEMERVNRELEEFAYVSSHDLQEPLRMVNIYTQRIVRRVGKDNPEIRDSALFVEQGVARMQTLIRDLLTYSRTIQSEEDPHFGSADLHAVLAESVSVLKDRIAESGAVITADPLPSVRGEPQQLAHVFQNLLSNALKYHKSEVQPEVRVRSRREGDLWIVSVADNGIGFDQRYAERIFGLFKRLHKDEYPGTGLGLAICQRIIERYGGRIWAESQPGVGSTFHFSLHDASAH